MPNEKLVMSLKGVVYERSNGRKTVWHNRNDRIVSSNKTVVRLFFNTLLNC